MHDLFPDWRPKLSRIVTDAGPTRAAATQVRATLGRMILALLLACSGLASLDDTAGAVVIDYAQPGALAVGRSTHQVSWGERELPVELWYPATAPTEGVDITELAADATQRATYQALLDAAPPGCPTTTTQAGAGTPAAGPWPLVLMSHCHGCTRYSKLSVAAHIASHGMVVAAPDHVGNTLYDELAGEGLPLNTDTLALRVGDLRAVRDIALAGELGVEVDSQRVGVVGHSFGAVTAGKLLQDELGQAGAPLVGAFIGAPVDNPLLAGVDAAALDAPTLFLVLAEDHSIGAAGNTLIENNHAETPGPSWLLELADAGHWSPSDLLGLTDGFMPGCGDDERQDGGADFTYADPQAARASTGAVIAAFLADGLGLDPAASTWLRDAQLQGVDITAP